MSELDDLSKEDRITLAHIVRRAVCRRIRLVGALHLNSILCGLVSRA